MGIPWENPNYNPVDESGNYARGNQPAYRQSLPSGWDSKPTDQGGNSVNNNLPPDIMDSVNKLHAYMNQGGNNSSQNGNSSNGNSNSGSPFDNVLSYNPVQYSGFDQFGNAKTVNNFTQGQQRDQAGWQQGQQLAYNDALNKQNQLAFQQSGATVNAARNAQQQRDLVSGSANTLNQIYGNSMQQMNNASANTQNTLASLANTSASMFR